jgi:hypothetical protein
MCRQTSRRIDGRPLGSCAVRSSRSHLRAVKTMREAQLVTNPPGVRPGGLRRGTAKAGDVHEILNWGVTPAGGEVRGVSMCGCSAVGEQAGANDRRLRGSNRAAVWGGSRWLERGTSSDHHVGIAQLVESIRRRSRVRHRDHPLRGWRADLAIRPVASGPSGVRFGDTSTQPPVASSRLALPPSSGRLPPERDSRHNPLGGHPPPVGRMLPARQ